MSTAEQPASSLPNEGSSPANDTSLLAKAKRKLLGLGEKKEEDAKVGTDTDTDTQTTSLPPDTLLPSPPLTSPSTDRRPSPRGSPRIYPAGNIAVSPSRRIRSTSPGLHSPASSQIFERNVQEPEDSSAIPAHIKTEDHIPAALDASSLAITDSHLDPDEVEIVTATAHQPASAAVAGSVSDSIYHASFSQEDIPMSGGHAELGSLDTTTDVRRLSFISFADVVQAEHFENDRVESDRDTMQYMSLSSTANRSPSPIRSLASSRGGFSVSPPTSGAASEKGADFFNKGARVPGSPTTTAHSTHSPSLGGVGGVGGDVHVETMGEALRKTGSDELGGARSQRYSAVSLEDSLAEHGQFK
ncbi:hypothetical protein K504DRAFT_458355 [Pleomassaria siparia CBS 279.74]|uniref:Uncharacterized protein n=1 Tax=Pleomassaria siparia CBS 279.74 TaxID=1314801 RepID=A0A6G1K5Z7_9PLEO|nr:hypothetical protein K504DRAFT_458355 [Pleomassaria siparia CBS 279.74]